MDLGDRVLRSALRAEAVGARLEVRLEDRFEHQLEGGLHGPIPGGPDAQRPQLPVGLGIITSRAGNGRNRRAWRSSRSSTRNRSTPNDRAGSHSIDAGRPCPSIPAYPIPRNRQEGGIADKVVEVIEPTTRIVDCPSMQLGLDAQYSQLGLDKARPQRVGVHRRPPDVPARRLRTCCPPSPCAQLSCARTTTRTPSQRRAVR